jgi:branched-chain amino acid transport system substrate-binding protein
MLNEASGSVRRADAARQPWTRRRLLLAALAASTAALAQTACTMTLPEPSAPAPTVAPSVPGSEINLGLVLSLSGRYSREGALMRAGYELWQQAVDQAGGLKVGDGRRALRVHLLDDESEPLTAGRQAERLQRERATDLFLGPFSSQITTAIATVTDRAGAVLVAPDASTSSLYRRGLKGLFSILPTEDRLLHGLADLAATVQPRAQPVGIIIADEPSNAAAAAGFRERAAALELGPVRLELTALGSTDIVPPLQRTSESTPRFVILATEAGQTARFAPSLREYLPYTSMRALIPLPEPVDRSGMRALLYDGILTVESWWPTIQSSGPVFGAASDYADRFRRLHGYAPDPRSAAATAAGLAMQLGIEAAGTSEPAGVRAALAGLDVLTFWGRLGWDTAGRNRAAVPPVLQQQGDELVCVYPADLAGGRLRYPLAGWPRG